MRALVAVLLAGGGFALAPTAARAQASSAGRPPNVVFVLADDLGWAELGSYGQRKIRTPSLDRLAAEGVRFTQHYSGNAVCAPSRSVLLTGRHPGHTPIRDNREVQPEGQVALPAATVTLAELFKARGYATGAMGKWGLGPPGSEGDPLKQGFDRFFGTNCQRQAHSHYPTHLYDDDRMLPLDNPRFSAHQKLPDGLDPQDQASYAGYAGKDYAPDLVWERARAFVRENWDRPFFLYLPASVPHLALQVPEDSLAEYRGIWPDPPYRGDKSYLPHPSPRAAYAAMVTRMDREVGRLLDLVQELGLDERTIVVFTSDNGPTYDRLGGSDSAFFESAGSFRGLKGSLYEGGVRVPAIVRWPGRVPAGLVSERVTGFEDWLPTLLELAGARGDVPGEVDGVSFAPTLLGRPQEPRPFLYREFPGYGGQQTVRVGDWKAVRQGLGSEGLPRTELYDLAADAGETRDVAGEHPEVVARLEAVLAREHQPSAAFPLRAIDGETPRYVVARATASASALLSAGEAAWSPAERITWGPEAVATGFRALWTNEGLALRYDVTDPSPWHTLAKRDEALWNEEVVELFLDVGATGRSYAEIEWNPVNAVVDLWVDRPENRFDKGWDAAGLESRVRPRKDAGGRTTGWTVTSLLPWRALAARATAGTALPPKPGDRWRFNAFRIERPGGPQARDKDAQFLAWSPTGHRSFHVPLGFREMVFAGSGSAPASPPAAAAAPGRRLNVVSIVTDDQGSWGMGAYGNPDARTPTLDRLAREGVLFRNAFVTTPVCSPSRAGFLTGRYGTELGIRDWISPDEAAGGLGLPPGTPTWPALLREAGWRTALVGKWHLGRGPRSHPSAFGIERFFGFLDGGNAPIDPTLEVEGRERTLEGSLPDLLADEAVRFVTESLDQPFALLLHFRAPHLPYGPVPEVDAAALRDVDPAVPDVRGLDREQVKRWTRDHLASIHSVDRNVGRLLGALDHLGLRERTVVLFTSDNGYNIGHHAIHTKGNGYWVAGGVPGPPRPNMFDTSLRVPLLVRGPGLPAGREVGEPVTQLDTLSTLLALLGVPAPPGLLQHGRDVSPLLRGEAVPWPDVVYGEFDMHHYTLARMRMVRTARHKLVRYLGASFQDELYDLEADPGETRNLYRVPEARGVREELEARLLEWRRRLGVE
jgi:arylsulfatase A-like enzyme